MALFAPITPPNSISNPKSATSRRTASSKVSKAFDVVTEHSESDVSDAESDVTFTPDARNDDTPKSAENTHDINEGQRAPTEMSSVSENKNQSRIDTTSIAETSSQASGERKTTSRLSKVSSKSKRTKLGNFIVKYGKYS